MTQSEQDYLKIIYGLGGLEHRVTNKAIAAALNISPPSVSEMIKKMVRLGYIKNEPYMGSQLTSLGGWYAKKMIRRHRLWEVFLLEYMNYDEEQVHEEAERLEHAMSDLLEERLYNYLGAPKHCPHGSSIPELEAFVPSREAIPLIEVKEKADVIIWKIKDDAELLKYLEEIELQLNENYQVANIASFKGPITLMKGEQVLVIGREAAKNIFVVYQ